MATDQYSAELSETIRWAVHRGIIQDRGDFDRPVRKAGDRQCAIVKGHVSVLGFLALLPRESVILEVTPIAGGEVAVRYSHPDLPVTPEGESWPVASVMCHLAILGPCEQRISATGFTEVTGERLGAVLALDATEEEIMPLEQVEMPSGSLRVKLTDEQKTALKAAILAQYRGIPIAEGKIESVPAPPVSDLDYCAHRDQLGDFTDQLVRSAIVAAARPLGAIGKASYPPGNVLCNEAILSFDVLCCGCRTRDRIGLGFPFREGPPTREQQRERVILWRRQHEAMSPNCVSSSIDILHPDEGPRITEAVAREPVIDSSCLEEPPAASWRDREPLL